jgi:hypothetical protein
MAGWSTTDKNAAITVSGTNNTVLTRDASAAANKIARYTTFYSTGKYYIEHTLGTTGTADDEAYGLAQAATSLTASLGFGATTHLGLYGEASNVARFLLNSVQTNYTLATDMLTSGRVISIAYDFGNKRAWVRVNGGNWNGSGTADPATNTGGFDFSGLTGGPWAFVVSLYDPSSVVTTNFGLTAFTYTVPSGFAGPEQVTAYTLALATGAITVGSNATALLYGRKIPLATGAITVGSNPITFKASRKLPLATGAITVGSNPVTFKASRKLSLATGAVNVAGFPVTLTFHGLAHYTLALDTGAITLAGNPVVLAYGPFLNHYVLNLDPGAITLTGPDLTVLGTLNRPTAGGAWETGSAAATATWEPVAPPSSGSWS